MNYPDFSDSKVMALDLETFDPELTTKGPGVYRSLPLDFRNKNGYILGVSLADEKGNSEYFNLGHYDCTEQERKLNIEYLTIVLAFDIPKLGANIMYDLDWLENWAMIPVLGQLYDVQTAEALIDENQGHYSLDFLAKKYLGIGKVKNLPEKFCYDNNLKGDFRKWLWKMPYWMVRDYAIGDVDEPVGIFRIQWNLLHQQSLLPLLHMECDLLRMNLYMRKTGVKIDTKIRNKNALTAQNVIEETKIKLFDIYGEFNFNSTQQIAKIFDDEGIPYQTTEKGNPSIGKIYLQSIEEKYEVAKLLLTIRKASKMLDTFLMGSYLTFITEGDLIHCSFYNTKNDEYGTRSGRLSSAKPNLQQIPSKGVDAYWGRLCREPFIPFDNCWWAKLDYSQIEYRIMAHYSEGPGSKELVDSYIDDPTVDYHQYIINLTGLKRRFAKNLNFGVAYGMGARHMAEFFGWTLEYAYEILDTYHSKAPYIKSTIAGVERQAVTTGFITTILGRRSRLLSKRDAYKMFCRRIQGSAADIMKKAMLDIYNSDVLDTLHLHLTVHDELDVSVPKTKAGVLALRKMRTIMQDAIPLKVPVKADAELGTCWADVVELDIDNTLIDEATDDNIVEVVESLLGESLNK